MKGKKAFAPSAKNILIFLRWKQTTLTLGAVEEKPQPKTAKCYARAVTEENQTNNFKATSFTDAAFSCFIGQNTYINQNPIQ